MEKKCGKINIGSRLENNSISFWQSQEVSLWLEKPIGEARANQIDWETDDQNADFDK